MKISVDQTASFQVRLIDCVGYIVPSALGYIENEQPRMVMTPWFDREIPFNMAAEIGTKKVITEHSTIGLWLPPMAPSAISRGPSTRRRRAG